MDMQASQPVPHTVDNPVRIPTARYWDEEFYRLEVEKLWPHVWQMACRLEQIPNEGDWIEYSNLGHSIIVVNAGEAGIRAFHNACRHRGVPLNDGEEHGNCKGKGFICPFHGWRWNAKGENTFVYGQHLFGEEQLDKDDLALRRCRSEEWGGYVFINLDDEAPSLHETMGPVLDNLDAHGMSKLKYEWWYQTELPANWKLAMEAFMEGYHVMRTHPQLQQAAPALYNSMYGYDTGGIGVPINPNATVAENISAQVRHFELLSSGMAGMVHDKEVKIIQQMESHIPEVDDPQQAVMHWFGAVNHAITEGLRAAGEDVPDLNAVAQSHPVHAVEFLFPHMFLLPMFTSMSGYRIRPTGPETCIFEIYSLTHDESEDYVAPKEPTILPYDSQEFPEIPRQDYSNIPIQQLGTHAKGFEFMRLSHKMEGLISNYNRIIDGHLRGVDPAKLAKATNELGGNFDGPVKDLDLD